MFALGYLFLSHVLKALFFKQNSHKKKLFLQKVQNFRALGAPPANPRASGGWGLCPHTPKTTPIATFWLRAWIR